MSMRGMLQEGEYTIADCREIVANGKVMVFKRKQRTLKENDFRCRDCVHYLDILSPLKG